MVLGVRRPDWELNGWLEAMLRLSVSLSALRDAVMSLRYIVLVVQADVKVSHARKETAAE